MDGKANHLKRQVDRPGSGICQDPRPWPKGRDQGFSRCQDNRLARLSIPDLFPCTCITTRNPGSMSSWKDGKEDGLVMIQIGRWYQVFSFSFFFFLSRVWYSGQTSNIHAGTVMYRVVSEHVGMVVLYHSRSTTTYSSTDTLYSVPRKKTDLKNPFFPGYLLPTAQGKTLRRLVMMICMDQVVRKPSAVFSLLSSTLQSTQ